MEIPGPAYLIVGAVLIGVSFSLSNAGDRPLAKYTIFIFAGVVFWILGIMKFVTGKSEKVAQSTPHHHVPSVKYCPSCRSAVRVFDQVCFRCGQRFR